MIKEGFSKARVYSNPRPALKRPRGNQMKRRKFLKLLSWSPFMFLVPGVFLGKKVQLKQPETYIGNGTENRVITGMGFKPKYIIRWDAKIKSIAKTHNIPKSILSKR